MTARAWLAFVLMACLLGAAPPARQASSQASQPSPPPPGRRAGATQMKQYDGRYYRIHTDLAGDDLLEAELRMARMAEEYHERTRDFSGAVTSKFPFFLYRNPSDYHRAGGPRGTAGFFDRRSNTLVAIAGKETTAYTWSVVQHEGFHQFAANVIGGELPIWVNEGLAEYFGEGLFTGDGFVTGVIPPERLKRIKKQMAGNKFRPIKSMMLLAHRDWNEEMTLGNYDQAWSMVQFLAHAENGRYAGAFVGFMRAIGKGQPWPAAWLENFGTAEGFEKRWRDYWMKLPDNATPDLYARATLETITSVLARATAKKQRFTGFDELVEAAAGQGRQPIKFEGADWLPPALVRETFERATKMRAAGIDFDLPLPQGTRPPTVVCTLKDGRKMVGRFEVKEGAIEVTVDVPKR